MKSLSIETLSDHSPWAAYLAGDRETPPDDSDQYTALETYEAMHVTLLEAFRYRDDDPDAFVHAVRSRGRGDPAPLSIDEVMYLASTTELLALERGGIAAAMAPFANHDGAVVDLGSGWGNTLGALADAIPHATVVGYDGTESGVALARELTADRDRVTVEHVDLTGDWTVPSGSVLFSKASLTTLDDVPGVVDRFGALADTGTVLGGVHLEPIAIHPDTELGRLRRAYADARGYDESLLEALESDDSIAVTHVRYDVFGANPLHPVSLVRWHPRL